MILHHVKRTVPQLNTTSTADISFILLVFFLIMTSMDVDKGLVRTLPPMQDDNRQETVDVEKGNVLELRITPAGNLIVNGKTADTGKLRRRVATFVEHSADRSGHVITLDVDRKAPYNAYFNVQNEIAAAYKQLRNAYATKTYGHAYALCTPEQREAVRRVYPQRIVETSAGDGKGGAE